MSFSNVNHTQISTSIRNFRNKYSKHVCIVVMVVAIFGAAFISIGFVMKLINLMKRRGNQFKIQQY